MTAMFRIPCLEPAEQVALDARNLSITELVRAASLQSDRALEALLRAAIAERVGPDIRPEDIASRLTQTFTAIGRLTTYHLDGRPILETRPPEMKTFSVFVARSTLPEVAFMYRQFPA